MPAEAREPWRNSRHRSVQRFVERLICRSERRSNSGSPATVHEINVAALGSRQRPRRADMITHRTMNRASGAQGHRYVNAYATRNKTLETKTLDAGRGPTEFFPAADPDRRASGTSAKTLDTVASNVSSPFCPPYRGANGAIGNRARVRGCRGVPSAIVRGARESARVHSSPPV